MKILVTGSNGFIGSHVSAYLRKKGEYVVGLGRSASSKTECDDYVCCDLSSESAGAVLGEIEAMELDAVVHLAADMRHEPYGVNVVQANCVGTQRLIEMCENAGIPVFVQLSSLPVIGTPVDLPIKESHPLHPPTVYHATKVAMEMLADYATYTHGLRTVSLRICSPVGRGVNPKTIFPVFVSRALAGEDIILSGNGSRKQTYIHVLDIADAVYRCVLSPQASGVYNLASCNLVSNLELAERCIDLLNSDSQIVFSGKEDVFDGVEWQVCIDKLRHDTGFDPQYGIDYAILDYARTLKADAE